MRRNSFREKYEKELALGRSPMYSLRMTNDEILAMPIGTITNFGTFKGVVKNEHGHNRATFKNIHRGTDEIPFAAILFGGKRILDDLRIITDKEWEDMELQYRETVVLNSKYER
jgi:hypothetical protein